MPQIPTYDGPQVQTRALNYDQGNADAFGGAQAKTLGQVGAGAAGLAESLDKLNERQVTTSVFNAEAQAKTAYVEWSGKAMQEGQGAAAKGLTQRGMEWWDKAGQDLGKGLDNPMAQQMLTRALANQRAVHLDALGKYELHQTNIADGQAADANISASVKAAAALPVQANIELQRQNIIGALQQFNRSGRLDPATFKEKVDGALSDMQMGVFNNLLAVAPLKAKQYLDMPTFEGSTKTNRDEINPLQYDDLTKRLKAAVGGAEGHESAKSIFAELGPKGPGQPVDLEALNAAADAKYKDDPDTAKATRDALASLAHVHDYSEQQKTGSALKDIKGMAFTKGMSMSQIKSTPQWAALSSGDQADAVEQISAQNHARFARSVSDRELAQRSIELNNAPKMWAMVNNPAALAAMTETEISTLWTKVGPQNAEKIIATRQHLMSSQAKLSEAKVDADMFVSIAETAGLEPTKQKKSPEEALALVNLRNDVEFRIGQEQGKMKRELTRPEKMQIMQQEVDNKVMTGGIFGLFSTARPVSTVPTKDLKNTFVTFPGTARGSASEVRVDLATIPAEDRAAIMRARSSRGLPVSEQIIAQKWYEAKQLKGTK